MNPPDIVRCCVRALADTTGAGDLNRTVDIVAALEIILPGQPENLSAAAAELAALREARGVEVAANVYHAIETLLPRSVEP